MTPQETSELEQQRDGVIRTSAWLGDMMKLPGAMEYDEAIMMDGKIWLRSLDEPEAEFLPSAEYEHRLLQKIASRNAAQPNSHDRKP